MMLAKHGVLDALTKAIAKIQECQPENPLEVSEKKTSRKFSLIDDFALFSFSLVPPQQHGSVTRSTRQNPRPRIEAQRRKSGNFSSSKGSRSFEFKTTSQRSFRLWKS
jgi:hypothetical protein